MRCNGGVTLPALEFSKDGALIIKDGLWKVKAKHKKLGRLRKLSCYLSWKRKVNPPVPTLDSEEFACNAGDLGWIPGSGRAPGEGNGNPL